MEGDTRMKLLMVNDAQLLLKGFLSLLKALAPDIQMDSATNGDDALRLCREGRYDVVLTDLDHPGLNGVELAEQILRENKRQRLGFVTAWAPGQKDDRLKEAYAQMEEFIHRAHLPVFTIGNVEPRRFVQFVRAVAKRKRHRIEST